MRSISSPVYGALWMSLAACSLASLAVMVRYLAPTIPIAELIFFRNIISLLIFVPWVLRVGFSELHTSRLPLHVFRNSAQYLGMLSWFFAVTIMPLADLAGLQFTVPLFTMFLAAVLLNEQIKFHRGIAAGVGFVGALIIIRPGFAEVGVGVAAIMMAAILYSITMIATKRLSSTESGSVVAFYMALLLTPISLIPALFDWTTPSWEQVPAILALGLVGHVAVVSLTRAFASADASFVMPFDFLRLPFAALFGFVLFNEIPEIWVPIGGLLIFLSTYYMTWQESRT